MIRKTGIFLAVIFFLILWSEKFDWLAFMEKTLVVSDPLQKVDVLIVPSGSSMEERIRYAAKLYREGYSAVMLLAGHMTLQEETGIDLMKVYAMKLGVPENAILRESNSETTWENALASRKLLQKQNCRAILIVTSPQHTKRAKMLFRKVFSVDISVAVSSVELPPTKEPWYSNDARLRAAVHEYLSFAWFYLTGQSARGGDWG